MISFKLVQFQKPAALSNLRYYLLLLILSITGYFSLAFMLHVPVYDMLSIVYPWRYFNAECITNGFLPLWNPYMVLGTPVHADPGTWYPVSWVIGSLFGYNVYSLNAEFILHIFIASSGMFFLGRTLEYRKDVSLLIGVCYMFCGFIIGNSQHFSWVISAAWMPFALALYLRFSKDLRITTAIKCSIVLFMMFTGGYFAVCIMLFYLLLALFLYFETGSLIQKNKKKFFRLLLLNITLILAFVLMSSVVLVSSGTMLPDLERAGGVNLQMAQSCPLSPQSMISFILPYAAIRDLDLYGTDLSMTNVYFGLIAFLFFIYSLFLPQKRINWVFMAAGLLFLAASTGDFLPVRELLYRFVPFLDLFRFSAMFRLIPIFTFILMAGYSLTYFLDNGAKRKKTLIVITSVLSAFLIISLVYSFLHSESIIQFIKTSLFGISHTSTIWQHMFVQSVIQLGFILLLIASLIFVRNIKRLALIIVLLGILDTFIASNLNQPYTVYSPDKASEMMAFSRKLPEGFPAPANESVGANTDAKLAWGPMWKNMNTFYKLISSEGINPYMFIEHTQLMDTFPDFYNGIIHNNPVFLSGNIFPADSLSHRYADSSLSPSTICLENDDWARNINLIQEKSENDTAWISSCLPNKMIIQAINKNTLALCLLQNMHSGWIASVDGKNSQIMRADKTFMAVTLPPGEHTVVFQFRPKVILVSLWISCISFFSLLLYVIASLFIKRKSNYDQ